MRRRIYHSIFSLCLFIGCQNFIYADSDRLKEFALREVLLNHPRKDIAKKYEISLQKLQYWIRCYNEGRMSFDLGISQIPSSLTQKYSEEQIQKILQEMIDQKMVREEVTIKYGISRALLKNWISGYEQNKFSFRLTKSPKRIPFRSSSRYPAAVVQEILEQYFIYGRSRADIFENYALPRSTLSQWVRQYKQGNFPFKISYEKHRPVFLRNSSSDILPKKNLQRAVPNLIYHFLTEYFQKGKLCSPIVKAKISLEEALHWVKFCDYGGIELELSQRPMHITDFFKRKCVKDALYFGVDRSCFLNKVSRDEIASWQILYSEGQLPLPFEGVTGSELDER